MIISSVTWANHPDGSVDLTFRNHLTGVEETRHYKTHRGAACAETRFINRVRRLYDQQQKNRIEVHIPGLDYDD